MGVTFRPSASMENRRRAVIVTMKILELAAVSAMYFLLRFGGRDGFPLSFSLSDLSMLSVGLVGGSLLTTLLVLLCHICWGPDQPTHLEISLLFSQFTAFAALGTLTILYDKGTFDDRIESGVRFGKEVIEEVFDLNVKFNEDGAVVALGYLGVVSSFLFLIDMSLSLALGRGKQET